MRFEAKQLAAQWRIAGGAARAHAYRARGRKNFIYDPNAAANEDFQLANSQEIFPLFRDS